LENNLMTYLFSGNSTISNEVEIKNDVGNALPVWGNVWINNNTSRVTILNPLPVTLGSSNITIIGNTNIIDTVTVASTPQNPVHVHVSEIGTSGNILTSFMPVGGNVYINNNSSTVSISNPLPVTGNVNIITTGNQGKLWTMQVTQGLIAGHTTEQITGYNPTTSAGDAVWSGGTPYPWSSLATAQTLYLKSSTNNATDRGMSIFIDGLDANYNNQTEVVTLNASDSRTAVATTKQFLRIHEVRCNGADTNVGDITTTVTSGSGTVVSKMSSGRGSAKAGVYTIPAGYTGYLFKGDASSTAATVVNFMGRYYGKAFMVLHVAIVDNSTYIYDFPFPLVLPEKTDMYTVIEAGSGKTAVNYELLLVVN
jgi:hypothetical protein